MDAALHGLWFLCQFCDVEAAGHCECCDHYYCDNHFMMHIFAVNDT